MRIVDRITGISGDKWVHLLACQVIAFTAASLDSIIEGRLIGACIGCFVAVAAGVAKELIDDHVDKGDLIADVIGAAMGTVYFLI